MNGSFRPPKQTCDRQTVVRLGCVRSAGPRCFSETPWVSSSSWAATLEPSSAGAASCGLNFPFSVFQIQMLRVTKMLSACVADTYIYIFFFFSACHRCLLNIWVYFKAKAVSDIRKHFKICFLSQSRQSVRPFKTSLQTDYHLAVSSAQRPANTKIISDAFAVKMPRPALRCFDQKMKRFTGNHCSRGDFRAVCTYPILEKGCMKVRRRRWYWYQTNLFWARIM